MLTLDAHCDSPSQMLRLRDFSIDNPHAQVDFPKMKRGGVDCSVFALYIPARFDAAQALSYARRLLNAVDNQLDGSSAVLVRSSLEIAANSQRGLLSVMLGLENASPIAEDFNLLYEFQNAGVRYITLTHSRDNQVGDSCTGTGSWGGLSPFGRRLVREMNSSGTVIDLSHAADSTIRDVLTISNQPLVYTHGCCRSLCPHRRNISDELMRGIAGSGGVVGISIYPLFLSEEFAGVLADSGLEDKMWIEDEFIADSADSAKRTAWWELQDELARLARPGVDRVVDHIEHALDVCGLEHVGIGTDYDGIEVTAAGLESISSLPLIWDEMRRRGFSESEISAVAGANFIRIFE